MRGLYGYIAKSLPSIVSSLLARRVIILSSVEIGESARLTRLHSKVSSLCHPVIISRVLRIFVIECRVYYCEVFDLQVKCDLSPE